MPEEEEVMEKRENILEEFRDNNGEVQIDLVDGSKHTGRIDRIWNDEFLGKLIVLKGKDTETCVDKIVFLRRVGKPRIRSL